MEQLSDQSREFQRALTTWMIDQRAGGVFCPEVTPSVVNLLEQRGSFQSSKELIAC